MIRFTIPGNPIPKARPRVVHGHAYTDPRTEMAEAWVAMHARKAKVRWTEAPVALRLAFFRKDAVSCDLDNLVKLVQDALNGLAWKDDRQIVWLNATKAIDKANPRSEVEILDPAEIERPGVPTIEEDAEQIKQEIARAIEAWK